MKIHQLECSRLSPWASGVITVFAEKYCLRKRVNLWQQTQHSRIYRAILFWHEAPQKVMQNITADNACEVCHLVQLAAALCTETQRHGAQRPLRMKNVMV